ncbi:hypothetical protein [Nocardia otitidiscaviarum]|uniref:hypothetical protein n=1 Tax=Nocardia otitidiscaviarum TaxID=1823 RepID=UPI002457B7D5|nr:hypothetical protein [Nocardia otitidiscaviarum]
MHHEHEEAMRADFTTRTDLTARAYHDAVTDTQLDEIYTQTRAIDDRWGSGPHADQWQFLSDAHQDWRDRPDTMTRFLDNVEHNRAKGYDGGIDDVQRRSLYQARELTAPASTRRRGPIQRER